MRSLNLTPSVELNVVSCYFSPFFVQISIQIFHSIYHQINSFGAGFVYVSLNLRILKSRYKMVVLDASSIFQLMLISYKIRSTVVQKGIVSLKIILYSSLPNKRVYTLINFGTVFPLYTCLLGHTRLFYFEICIWSKEKIDKEISPHETIRKGLCFLHIF